MKVFVVFVQTTYEFEVDVNCAIFSSKELAKSYWEDEVEIALSEAEEALDADEIVEDIDVEHLSCDIYKDGSASEWEYNLWVVEKEVIEK